MPLAMTSRGDSRVHRQDALKGGVWWENYQELKGRASQQNFWNREERPGYPEQFPSKAL